MDVPTFFSTLFVALSEGVLEELLHLDIINKISNDNSLGLFIVSLKKNMSLGRNEDFSCRLGDVLKIAWAVWEDDRARRGPTSEGAVGIFVIYYESFVFAAHGSACDVIAGVNSTFRRDFNVEEV